ncbi:DNA polymerase III subunit beta [Nocardia sp. CDC159]|uniref:Beta sliding clamp n=1 Tax=Nocardia pulmonis TaxID=2951408 RepID=A0A9X2IUJ6_9NOCA|nr:MULTISPECIES: DNA polymerase III subunit beta [Nocardia]MCM6772178.1 DNA polymerase III subunit beta [Nocardia pulmonis]MCM6785164.1 DNA polymerase III subunit beta [Nocardia sp. CDC159]
MKVRVGREALVRAISVVAHSLPGRPPVPILAGMLVRATGESVTVATFDHEVSSCAVLADAVVGEPGAALVSGRLVMEIAKALPPRPIELAADGAYLRVVCGTARFALPLMAVEDYPALPAAPPILGTVDGAEFAEAVARATVAAGRDDTLPLLTGVNLEFHGSWLRLVCTDRFRIAVHELGWTPVDSGKPEPLLIPARTLAAAAKTCTGDRVELGVDASGSVFALGARNARHTMRLLDLPYAPYQRYLAAEHTTLARVDTAALIESVRRVALLATRGSRIQLTFAESAVRLTAGDDSAGHAEEMLPAQLTGPPLTTAFNPRYLLDGLQAVHLPRLEIVMSGPTRAVTFRPIGDPADGQRRLHVLMPIRPPG